MASVTNTDDNDKTAFCLYPVVCIHRNKYKGRSINKLQNSVILLVLQI